MPERPEYPYTIPGLPEPGASPEYPDMTEGLSRPWLPEISPNGTQSKALVPRPRALARRNGPGQVHGPELPARSLVLTPASTIKMRAVRWAWADRLPLGSLSLLAGREGIGKSTVALNLAASITRGTMEGEFLGQPKSVIIAATEDAWDYTIVPRLVAARADLDRVHRVDVVEVQGFDSALVLPSDLHSLEEQARAVDALLVILDPLLSRLDSALDSYKDADVRRALEPLTASAARMKAVWLGLIDVNKNAGTDPLNSVMASRAFGAVARAILYAMRSPDFDQDRTYLLGEPKNNLGRSDLPTFTYQIEPEHVGQDDDGLDIWTCRVRWTGESSLSIHQALVAAGESSDSRHATADATAWLSDYLADAGGKADSAVIKKAAVEDGHATRTLQRARQDLHLVVTKEGFPRKTFWELPKSVTK